MLVRSIYTFQSTLSCLLYAVSYFKNYSWREPYCTFNEFLGALLKALLAFQGFVFNYIRYMSQFCFVGSGFTPLHPVPFRWIRFYFIRSGYFPLDPVPFHWSRFHSDSFCSFHVSQVLRISKIRILYDSYDPC